ncbi:hypothetical protein [Salipiger mucosus]|uniref:Uncharacterized protein n=1 Tax=Salipiger mucosus DSM 16094 TaxID=1123237 RepID=S9SER8_9RHOB|nr:hypothetical protein [Salipiger mucosus]EPX84779.1 hypothetical protein Salmuc_01352 [Salipiger mucosus DSM 16094]
MKIDYNIPPFETEADVRLADSMLYAALVEELGDIIEPFATLHEHSGDRPLWGRDRFRNRVSRIAECVHAYSDPSVLSALDDARIVSRHAVADEMDRLARQGVGAVLRNMRDPVERVRFCQPGDRFESHATAIGADRYDHDVLVQSNRDLKYLRRFLVVGGVIAGESPVRHCSETPLDVLDPENRDRQSRLPWSELEPGDTDAFALQREIANGLLSDFPLASGAIDVGLCDDPDVGPAAYIESVTAGRPGDLDTFFADPRTYARAIAENLHLIEPAFAIEPTAQGAEF